MVHHKQCTNTDLHLYIRGIMHLRDWENKINKINKLEIIDRLGHAKRVKALNVQLPNFIKQLFKASCINLYMF